MTKRGRPQHPDTLTPAEWRVVEGVRHGLSNPAIAARCGLSVDAVKFHVGNALGKLGLASRRELQRWDGVRADSALAGASAAPAPWTLGQVARLTRQLAATADWLRDVVGLPELMRFDTMAFFDCGGVRLYLSEGDPAANSLLYFRVADLRAEAARLTAAGVPLRSAPHRIHVHPDGTEEWMAFFTDPEGGTLALMSSIPPAPGETP